MTLLVENQLRTVEDGFRVQIDVFEGPLDLLLFLIRKNELEITELALAEITSQYLAYLDVFKALSISIASDYLLYAATLVEIKSGALVPRGVLDAQSDEESPSEELVRRLREHAQLRVLSEQLGGMQEFAARRWIREAPRVDAPSEVVLRVSLAELCYALGELARSARKGSVHHVRLDEWSVPHKMQQLAVALERDRRVDLTRWLQGCLVRGEQVALLLAALELVRAIRPLRLLQSVSFSQIDLVMEES